MTIQGLRKYLSWLFAFTALVCLQMSILFTPKMLHEYQRVNTLPPSSRFLVLFLPWLLPSQTVVFGMAWWTSFKAKRSARVWGIIASLVNIAVALFPLAIPPHSLFNAFLPILGLGIVGLVAFARPIDPSAALVDAHEAPAISGDCTNRVLNKVSPLLLLVAGGAAFSWWLSWIRTQEVPFPHSNSYLMLMFFLLGTLIVTLHEFGHVTVGLVLGMKLRALFVGPLQWRVRDGRWKFRFDPKQILVDSGGAGLVPTRINFPRWASVFMLFGGIFANALTGSIAVWLALNSDTESSVQAGGLLALFGAGSLVTAAVNLIPFRMQTGSYSDGAQICQLLANSVWADVHRAFGVVGASLVTPVRPRDYDIETIVRASSAITQGAHGLVLRLLAYTHFLDRGDFARAGEELTQAGLIYNQSASNIPGELLVVFVFGTALIWRNAEGTRAWWAQMEGKKGIRFNAEYWLAASALAWVEGNLKSANEALGKATSIAEQLPRAGAYEFERHCCRLLRHALEEVPVTTTSA